MNLLTHQFETSKCRLLAVNLPEGAKPVCIDNIKHFGAASLLWLEMIHGSYKKSWHYLPPGDWEILKVTEEKAREVVDDKISIPRYNEHGYPDYKGDNRGLFETALESFESLIASEIKTVNKYGEKPVVADYEHVSELKKIRFRKWQAEQATVFDNYIILISKNEKV